MQHWQNLVPAISNELIDASVCKELFRVCRLSETLKEDWEVMVVVKHLYLNFPLDLSGGTIEINNDWHVISLVECVEKSMWQIAREEKGY